MVTEPRDRARRCERRRVDRRRSAGDEIGEDSGSGQRVGIEFLTPAPHFWGMEFSQPDWTSTMERRADPAQN